MDNIKPYQQAVLDAIKTGKKFIMMRPRCNGKIFAYHKQKQKEFLDEIMKKIDSEDK